MTYMDPMGSGKGEKLVPNKNLRNGFILAEWFFQLQNFVLGESSQLGSSCTQKKHKSRLLIQCTPEVSDRPGKGTVPRKLQHSTRAHPRQSPKRPL